MSVNEVIDHELCLRVVLRESGTAQIYDVAQECSDPSSPRYGQYLTREQLSAMTLPANRQAVLDLFRSYGQVYEVGQALFYVTGPQTALNHLFNDKTLDRFVKGTSGGTELRAWEWDSNLAAFESSIRSVHVARRPMISVDKEPEPVPKTKEEHDARADAERKRRKNAHRVRYPYQDLTAPFRGWLFADHAPRNRPRDLHHPLKAKQDDRIEDGLTPAMIKKHYNFPDSQDCSGQTIAMMAVGVENSHASLARDMEEFWVASGVARKAPGFVRVGPPEMHLATSNIHRFEASMGPSWIGALAPQAQIIIYDMATDLPDPWLAAVEMAIADQRTAPTVICMTWTVPEEAYYRQFNRSAMAFALAKAAALGITVIAASGDWGVYDGRPGATLKDEPRAKVARAAWPHATFPSSEEQILSVGGTLLAALEPATEIGWSGPLPPDPALAAELPFTTLASSGGFSERVPVPEWQRDVVEGRTKQRSYSRGSSLPEVLPYGRGYPDVALMAAGPSLTRGSDPGPSATGYQLVVNGEWLNYAGGTSMAAPIWASIVALANAERVAARQPQLGFVNPVLYYLGQTRPMSGKYAVLRKIKSGTSDIEFRVVSGEGRSERFTLAGYRAQSQWDPVTGLGVPNVNNLLQALLEYPKSSVSAGHAPPSPVVSAPAPVSMSENLS